MKPTLRQVKFSIKRKDSSIPTSCRKYGRKAYQDVPGDAGFPGPNFCFLRSVVEWFFAAPQIPM